jgi:hypothetical protein
MKDQPMVPLAVLQLRLGEEKRKRLAAEAKAATLQDIVDRMRTDSQSDREDLNQGLQRYLEH